MRLNRLLKVLSHIGYRIDVITSVRNGQFEIRLWGFRFGYSATIRCIPILACYLIHIKLSISRVCIAYRFQRMSLYKISFRVIQQHTQILNGLDSITRRTRFARKPLHQWPEVHLCYYCGFSFGNRFPVRVQQIVLARGNGKHQPTAYQPNTTHRFIFHHSLLLIFIIFQIQVQVPLRRMDANPPAMICHSHH